MMTFIKKLKAEDSNKVKYIQLDNADENLGLKSKIEAEGLSVKLEFTSPETPEQNGQVERSFMTLWGRVRAMLNRSGVPQELREKLWAECASTATKLSDFISKKNGKSAFFEYYGEEPGYTNKLRLFGELGTKLLKLYGSPDKLSKKDSHCMFVGFAEGHPQDTYRVLDLKTQGVMLIRNVRWSGKTIGEFFDSKNQKIMEGTDLESSEEEEINLPELKTHNVQKHLLRSRLTT
jgi:hypothetical protein